MGATRYPSRVAGIANLRGAFAVRLVSVSVAVAAFRTAAACATHATPPIAEAPIVFDASVIIDDRDLPAVPCVTLASHDEPLHLGSVTVDGTLYDGRDHCYLDLDSPLCVRFRGEPGETEVGALRLAGGCPKVAGDVRVVAKLSGRVEPVRYRDGILRTWTVDALPYSLAFVRYDILVDAAGAPGLATKVDWLETSLWDCWARELEVRNKTGRLALDLTVAESGQVTNVEPGEGKPPSPTVARCVAAVARETATFESTDAGTVRHARLGVRFARTLTPVF